MKVETPAGRPRYVLRLCVSGMSARSREAIAAVHEMCERHLAGRYLLEVIDLHQQPEMARRHQIIATPTLIKAEPAPARRILGRLSDPAETLRRLGLAPAA